jgi:hypothetical protein
MRKQTVPVALGLKAHSGWAALVVLAAADRGYRVSDRRRIELREPDSAAWAAQPYHAAEGLEPAEAEGIVSRGIEAARRSAVREIRAAVERACSLEQKVVACAVLTPEPMPDWSTEQILSVHFRMHKAEGVLFPDALARAAHACGIDLVRIPEKRLWEEAEWELATARSNLDTTIAEMGKAVGSPWAKDQKNAALAAMIALASSTRGRRTS